MKNYKQVIKPIESELIIKKSKFITNLIPIKNSEDAELELIKIRKKYSDATHNCYAYISNIIATEQRFSDDGEPQGTAGIPMLDVIKKRDILMTLVVVTRYFGGVKLGANGLISAYKDSVINALDKAEVRNFIYSSIQKIELSYSFAPKISQMIVDFGGRVISTIYNSNVTMEFAVEEGKSQILVNKINDFCAGQINFEFVKKDFVDYV